MTDNEALRLYNDAENRMLTHIEERHGIMARLAQLANRVFVTPEKGVVMFDVESARQLVEQAAFLNALIEHDAAEMNSQAEKCGRSKVQPKYV